MSWYPLFYAWIQEADSSAPSLEEAGIAIKKLLEPILVTCFKRSGRDFLDTDVADCQDRVFERMERRLARPMASKVRLGEWESAEPERVVTFRKSARHVTFLLPLNIEDAAKTGGKVRLRAAKRVVWEGEYLAERYDARSRALPVQVPTGRLSQGQSYTLEVDAETAAVVHPFRAIRVDVLHLLRGGPFTLVGCHLNFTPRQTYRVELHKVCGSEAAWSVSRVQCLEAGFVLVPLATDQLQHEQDLWVRLAPDDGEGPTYFSCLRPVHCRTLDSRRKFVMKVARNVAHEHLRAKGQVRLLPVDDLKPVDAPHTKETEASRVALLMAKSLIKKLPERTRNLLIEHEVDGDSWAEVAERHGLSEDSAKQEVSRALGELMSEVLAGEPAQSPGGPRRLVSWFKETLELLFTRRPR